MPKLCRRIVLTATAFVLFVQAVWRSPFQAGTPEDVGSFLKEKLGLKAGEIARIEEEQRSLEDERNAAKRRRLEAEQELSTLRAYHSRMEARSAKEQFRDALRQLKRQLVGRDTRERQRNAFAFSIRSTPICRNR